MKWSRVKKRVEDSLAESVRGRVQFWTTRYRHSHDEVGEGWITLDRVRVASMGTQTYLNEYYATAHRLRVDRGCLDHRDSEQQEGYYAAYDEANRRMAERGIFSQWEFASALFEFLHMSIDQALISRSPIIRGLAVLDRRFGKRRLSSFDASNEHPLVAMLFEFRKSAEGMAPPPLRAMRSASPLDGDAPEFEN